MNNNAKWQKNGAGLWVSNQFGFGAVDAEAIVRRARHWVSVPEQLSEEHIPSLSTRCLILFNTLNTTGRRRHIIYVAMHKVCTLVMMMLQ